MLYVCIEHGKPASMKVNKGWACSILLLLFWTSKVGLEITVGHQTMADQNLSMSDEILIVKGQNVLFFMPSKAKADV